MIVAASFSACFESFAGSRTRKGWGSRRRGTAMITVLPSSRATRRAWVWGESGLALIVRARFQSRWPESFSAARCAPAKLGIRPSAPGNRDIPSRSIAFQTSLRTSSLERIDERYPPRRTSPQCPLQGTRPVGRMIRMHKFFAEGKCPVDRTLRRLLLGRKTKIAIVTGVVLVLLGAGRRLRLRQLPEGQDRRRCDDRRRRRRRHGRRRSEARGPRPAARPLSHSLRVGYDGESWKLSGKSLKITPTSTRRSTRPSTKARRAACPGVWSATSPAATSTSGSPPTSPTRSRPSTGSSAASPKRSTANRRMPRSTRAATPSKSAGRVRPQAARQPAHRQINAAVLNADADHTIVAVTTHEAGGDGRRSRRRVSRPTSPSTARPSRCGSGRPEAGQDVHGGGRDGRPRNPGRPLPHPGKGRKPDLE